MTEQNQKQSSLKKNILFLCLKIGIVIILIVILFLFVFGIHRCSDNMMDPAFKDGDLAIYYRIQKEYYPSDAVVLKKNDEKQIRRIVAKAGDVVDITEDGLKVNGYLQQENKIYSETLPYVDGITFPITLGQDEYFVLGDNRTNAKDSRIYGVVKQDEIEGVVITLLRGRGF